MTSPGDRRRSARFGATVVGVLASLLVAWSTILHDPDRFPALAVTPGGLLLRLGAVVLVGVVVALALRGLLRLADRAA